MSKQLALFYVTIVLLCGTGGAFLAFDARYLITTFSPVVIIVGSLLYVFTIAVLFRASFSDPGILPRATRTEMEWLERKI